MRYEFRISGSLSDTMAGAFPELRRQPVVAETVLSGPVTDGAHLHGLLQRFDELGLRVVEMRRLPE
ncbi:hypothetical protein V2S66_24750 [Streptomyces sp. V4-01]|uniref:Uncharacterized protein n=1 Tax=Actinacidiphila polyblastidii TaxID=3110430 RepID=A0ABU7PH69_9ACTN|nr:hypothetical protein [Streptomyces sp. V4-01]